MKKAINRHLYGLKEIQLLFILFLYIIPSYSQVVVQMQREEGGTFLIPGKINGLELKFVFDTGASYVLISSTEAFFMLKNGYLDESDIKGVSYSQIANGDIVENTEIILRNVEVGGIVLNNVTALVAHNLNAPLLLGQSAIQKLGPIQLDGDKLIIQNGKDFMSDEQANNLYLRGYQEIQNHQFDEAIETSIKGISLTNNKQILFNLYTLLAQAYSGNRDLDKAIDACNKGLSINPTDEYMAYNRCVFLFENNQIDMADEGFSMFLRNIQANPLLPKHLIFGTYSYLGQIKYSKGQYPASENYYLRAIENSPDSTNINMNSTYCGLANLYRVQKKYDKAIIYYEKGISLESDGIDNIEYYCALADCYNEISDEVNAITNYTKCLNLYYGKYYQYIESVIKDNVKDYIDQAIRYCFYGSMATRNLSRIYMKYYVIDKAIAGYKMIWDIEPMEDYIEYIDYVYLSEAYFASNDSITANMIIEQGLAKYPNNPDLLFVKAYNNDSDFTNNIILYNEIIRQENSYKPFRFDYATVYNNLAWAYCLQGNYEKGLPYSLKSVQMDSSHDYSWETLGEIYYNLGRYNECIDAMTKCIELGSNIKSAYEYRGNAKIKIGKKRDGERDLRTAENLSGD